MREDIGDANRPELQRREPREWKRFHNLNDWVSAVLVRIYNSPLDHETLWCSQWWMHDEAVYRLDALWRAWEYSRVNDGPMGAATWLVNYADPMMTELTKPDGCFNGCDTTQHRAHELNPGEELPTQDAPLPRPAPGEPLPKPQE